MTNRGRRWLTARLWVILLVTNLIGVSGDAPHAEASSGITISEAMARATSVVTPATIR